MELKHRLRKLRSWMGDSTLMTLVLVNLGVWLVLRVIAMLLWMSTGSNHEGEVCWWVELHAAPEAWPAHFYGIITYMFSQFGTWHLVCNMLWLYWFGRIYLEVSSGRSLFLLYLYGGLAGGVLFILAYNLLPHFAGMYGLLIGSSAAVLAIVVGTAIRLPDYPVNLLFLGMVRLKWVAVVAVVLVFLNLGHENTGGQIAHIGGALMGVVYGVCCRRGFDLTKWGRRRRRAPKPVASKFGANSSKADQEELDRILDKVRRSGYGALTPKERRRLFDLSSRLK